MSEMRRIVTRTALMFERGKGDKEYDARVGGLAVPYGARTELDLLGDVSILEMFEPEERPGFHTPDEGVRYLGFHDRSTPVANTARGTLRLDERKDGVYTDARLDLRDPDAQRIAVKAERGDLGGQSIGFVPMREDRTENRDEDGKLISVLYTVREFKLIEVSAVTWPAYESTSIGLRSRRDEVRGLIERERRLPPQQRARIARARHALTMAR